MELNIDEALAQGGAGRFQRRLLGIFGLVWAADAMQVIAIGFTAASIAASFGLTVPQALQTGTLFFLGMFVGATLLAIGYQIFMSWVANNPDALQASFEPDSKSPN